MTKIQKYNYSLHAVSSVFMKLFFFVNHFSQFFSVKHSCSVRIKLLGKNTRILTYNDFSEILYEEAEREVDKGYVTKTAHF